MADVKRARVAIPCGFTNCDRAAAVVESIPVGASYADGRKDILHALTGGGTLRVSGFLDYANYSTPVTDYDALVDEMQKTGDEVASALYRLSDDYAPFYCNRCRRSYCRTHWMLLPTFDQGFDYYSGHCPAGHPKVIDH